MAKVEVNVKLQIEERDIQKIYSGKYRKIEVEQTGDAPQRAGQIRIYPGAVVEVSKEVFKRLGTSVKRFSGPQVDPRELNDLSEEQIKALEELDSKRLGILGIEESLEVMEVTGNPKKKIGKTGVFL
ncbi:hypothetical protein MSSIH_2005 [Methanosarcina siciliae HI350]|uniref:Uncharacterized protein n=1 Tax=Methanosarcina siciliae HI350 TaxID=1434119 RepID=A0A0E3PDV7_9EURY|nr:hypothetical protein [Methanosarcina siciliae]AKB32695.1 hypothetical protein MSSIH_2005 [Methanosarcina siciliae HI350]